MPELPPEVVSVAAPVVAADSVGFSLNWYGLNVRETAFLSRYRLSGLRSVVGVRTVQFRNAYEKSPPSPPIYTYTDANWYQYHFSTTPLVLKQPSDACTTYRMVAQIEAPLMNAS